VLRVCALVRYRFFLYAGLLPYLLGAAWAYALADAFDGTIFLSGLAGVVLAVVGVEAFNEYFDSRMGTDRVFNPADLPPMTDAVLWLGIAAFAGALAVGVYLTVLRGWPILAFALLGGAAAIFYVAPPIRWAYRGLGELVIALSYGPWMVLGSLYLHTQKLSWQALVVSLVPGCLIMGLAVVNAIPDFHQDRLVGKRNLVVRLGRRRAVFLYLALSAAGLARRADRRRRRHLPVALPRRPAGAAAAGRERPRRAFDLRVAARLRSGGAQHRRLLPGRGPAAHRGHHRPGRLAAARMNRIDLLGAPLLVSWQITRDCDLCCLHCCTESAPGKRLPDELDADEAMRVADEIIRVGVPYVMLCGGEPLVVPHFLALAEKLGRAGSGSRSRATASASTQPSPNGSRACRSARCRSASTATPRRPTPASGSAPRWRPRTPPAAPCAPPACRSRSRSRRPASTCTRPAR
jgi:1,4-dihydroxy-2-naphthoate octaprenyltransferase